MRIRMVKLLVIAGLTLSWGAAQDLSQDDSLAAIEMQKEKDTNRLKDAWVPIVAFLNIPLPAADVEIYDNDGKLRFKKQLATNIHGAFPALVKKLPRNFRVVVSWEPRRNGDRSLLRGFDLSADVRDFDPEHDIVHVNAVTTLVSRVMDKAPYMGIKRAQTLVRQFLVLQPNASLGSALREGKNYQSRHFSHSAFLAQAVRSGGVDAYLNQLARRVISGPKDTQSFGAPQGIFTSAAAFVAKGLASGALSWAAGQGMGWAAQAAGITTPGATVADIANLQSSLQDLQSSIDDLKDDIASLKDELSLEIEQAGYQNTVAQAQTLQTQIDNNAGRLSFYALGCPAVPEGEQPPPPDPWCVENKQLITDLLNDSNVNGSFEALASQVIDNPVTTYNGLIHTYSMLMGKTIRFFRPADSTKMQAYADYWDASLVQAAMLKTEFFHLKGNQNNPGGIAEIQAFLGNSTANPPTDGKLQTTRNQEAQLVFPSVPTGTVIDTKTRFMWRAEYPLLWGYCQTQSPPASTSNGPVTGSATWNGMVGWSSPLFADFQTLVDGGGGDPMTWLIAQTKAVAPDSPTSPGFSDIVYASDQGTYWGYCTNKPWVWSVDTAPPINGNPSKYLFDFRTGAKRSAPTGPVLNTYAGEWYWLFLRRPLDSKTGEQYYWYQ